MQLKSRIIALPLAAVLASGALFSSSPAQAAPKSKTYKTGAVVLGAVGAYFLSKGKTLEGAAALGGGYLAYKQGEKERKNEKYNDRYGRYDNGNTYPNGSYNNESYNNGGAYNGSYSNGNYNNGGSYGNGNYHNGAYNNGSYNNGNYGGTYYNSNADYRYNNSSNGSNRNNDRQCRDNDNRSNNRSWRR